MAYHNSSIPNDPVENAKKLTGVLKRFTDNLAKKEAILASKQNAVGNIKVELDALTDPSTLTEEELRVADKKEQIMMGMEYDIECLEDEIHELESKIAWAERKLESVQAVADRKESLRFHPFVQLKTLSE